MTTRTGSHKTTPLKNGVSTGTFYAADKLVVERMRQEVGNYHHSNVDLLEFAEKVWGVDSGKAKAILNHQFTLDPQELTKFNECDREHKLHEPFTNMTNALLAEVRTLLHEQPATPAVGLWDEKGTEVLEGPRRRKPDMLNVWAPVPKKPTWATVKHVWEMKRPSTSSKKSRSLHQEAVTSSVGEKRPRGTDVDGEPCDKRRKVDGALVEAHLQLASYALECLASTSRYYMTGMLVNLHKVSVCYIDRTLILRVEEFNFHESPGKLALVVYAMNHCNRLYSGFDPRLRISPSRSQNVTRSKELREELPVDKPVGSYFEFEQQDGEKGKSLKPSAPHCFRVADIIRAPDDLISRGTAVYKVQRLGEDGKLSEDRYALKLSWPLKKRVSEIEVIEQLKKTLPVAVQKHLPNLTYSISLTAEQLGLPWTKMNLTFDEKNHQERVLRGLVANYYSKLWEAGSIQAFKDAWIDCVECHYQAWKTGRVLHRDLSENNLMVCLSSDGEATGILNDWDMATLLEKVDDNLSAAHHRTGTPPFMAIDLLCASPPEHLYRHDLESLFYILVWASVHYNITTKTREKKTNPELSKWNGSMDDNESHKFKFLGPSRTAEEVFKHVKPEFQGVLKNWIRPLLHLFRVCRQSIPLDPLDGTPQTPYDYETYDGRLTFHTFMAAIKVKPRWD